MSAKRAAQIGPAYLWIAKSRASAAMVFSPPDSWSMSRKRFIGGMAWYLMPALYGSFVRLSIHKVSLAQGFDTNLAVFQAEVCHPAHRRRLALGEILIHLVNALGDMVVGLVE